MSDRASSSVRPRRRLSGLRPKLEALEGRALLSITGGIDGTYGTLGLAQVVADPAPLDYAVTDETIQSDGKLLVVWGPSLLEEATPSNTSINRLNADGTPDATFGQQGVVILPTPGSVRGQNAAQAVAVQADGKILIASNFAPAGTNDGDSEIAIYRLNADGSTDTSFGMAGIVTYRFIEGTQNNQAYPFRQSDVEKLAIQADGKILVGAFALDSPSEELDLGKVALARFNTDGTLDTTFGTSGQVVATTTSGGIGYAGLGGLVIRSDGAIDYESNSFSMLTNSQVIVTQLNADGSVDTTFGTGGQVVLDAPGSTDYLATGLAIQPDGKLVATSLYSYTTMNGANARAFRLNANGTVDTTFGTMGVVTPVSGGTVDVGSPLIQPDGKILLGGEVYNASSLTYSPFLVRLNADGSTDTSFGIGGTSTLPQSTGSNVVGLTIGLDGKTLAATTKGVTRLLLSSASNDFDGDGTTDPAVLLPNLTPFPVFAYRPSSGGADVLEPYGTPGAGQTLPAPGAYDGSGIDELGVYLPAAGVIAYRPYGTTGPEDRFIPIGPKGITQAIPVPADYTESGTTLAAIYDPTTASFIYAPANTPDITKDVTVQFGTRAPATRSPSRPTTTARARTSWASTCPPSPPSPTDRPTAGPTSSPGSAPPAPATRSPCRVTTTGRATPSTRSTCPRSAPSPIGPTARPAPRT